ncbi:MAG: SGNH/GDSL hydrolase family protein, partial [Rhodospirillales bacterium]
FGLRNPEPVGKADGRIWVVGDSMAFGWGVEQDEAYSSVAGRLAGTPTYNVASPGTNVCGYQALLVRMPADAKPRAVILGLILENDVAEYDCRVDATGNAPGRGGDSWRATEIKMFLTRHTALYNFFAVSLKRVPFINDMLVSLGLVAKGHAYSMPLSAETLSTAVERTAAEIATLRAMLPKGTPLAVLIASTRFEIRDGDPFSRRLRSEVSAALARQDIVVIDPFEDFKRAGFGPTHFAHDGHWSPLGHDIAGRAVAEWLRKRGFGG